MRNAESRSELAPTSVVLYGIQIEVIIVDYVPLCDKYLISNISSFHVILVQNQDISFDDPSTFDNLYLYMIYARLMSELKFEISLQVKIAEVYKIYKT
jgi:hypothetical protein